LAALSTSSSIAKVVRIVELLSASRIRVATNSQLSDLLRIGECLFLRQRSPQVRFKELKLPTLTLEEGHKNAMARSVVATHIDSVGE
jgi:hypothetical protein